MHKDVNDLKLYQIAIDFIPISVVVYKKDGDDFVFVDFNKAAEIAENLKKESVIGKRLTDVFPNVKEFGLFEVLERVDKGGVSETFNLKFYEDERVSGWRENKVIKLPNGDIMAMYKNLTEAKQLEERVQNLSNFIDSSQTIVFFWSAEEHWPVVYVSNNISDFGYSPDDFLSGKIHYEDIIHPDDIARVSREVEDHTLNKNDKFIQVYRIIAADKSIRWIDDRTVIERDSNGVPTHYLGTIIDITEQKSLELNLQQSEEKFRTIAENSHMSIFIYRDKFIYVNQALCDITGYSAKELYSISPWEVLEKSAQDDAKNRMSKRLSGEKFPKKYDDLRFIAKSGQTRIVRTITETIRYGDGYAGLGTAVDITDVTETKKRLKMLAQAVEQTDDLVMITDKDGVITYINDAYIAQTGYKHGELIGKKPSIFKSGQHDDTYYKNLWDTIKSGKVYSNTVVNIKKDKLLYYEEKTITPIFDENNIIQNFVSTGRDITSRIKMEEELHKRATIDNLTGIFNRHSGNELIDLEVNKARRYKSMFTVLMLDIDNFKSINDTYGHDIGDYVLQKFTELISLHIRESDAFIRWGGEEFIIISSNLSEQESLNFAQKLRVAISAYQFEKEMKITISIGATTYRDKDTKESILKRADIALYKAKESGRNMVRYS